MSDLAPVIPMCPLCRGRLWGATSHSCSIGRNQHPSAQVRVQLGDRVRVTAEGVGLYGRIGLVTWIEGDDETLHVYLFGGVTHGRVVMEQWPLRRDEVERVP